MKGNIYPTKYGYQVRFGRKITRHFKTLLQAEKFLNGVRFKTDEGSFDLRDYKREQPLGFQNLTKQWLKIKKKTVKPRSYNNLKNYVARAVETWNNVNVKYIGYAEIEDFIYSRSDISDKTRHNIKSGLNSFWNWLVKRKIIRADQKPDFPEISFELGWRNIIDIETQQKIINEVWKISGHINPKIWLGIKFLATYISCRPAELLGIKEGQINIKDATIIIPHPKEKQPKLIYLHEEDLELLKSLPRGLPDMYFFRHPKGLKGAKAGYKFGNRYLYKYWIKACQNLGIEGVDLYGGTRHSTATALGRVCTPEEIQDATGHASKAFQRYFQGKQARTLKVTEKIKKLSNQHLINGAKVINLKQDVENKEK